MNIQIIGNGAFGKFLNELLIREFMKTVEDMPAGTIVMLKKKSLKD